VPDARRSQGRAAGEGPRWRRTGWRDVLWPLAVGLAFCALGLWAALVYNNNQAAFRAQAVPAKAVIDQIYAGQPVAGPLDVFDQYGIVHFEAQGRTANARVLLVAGCSGTCLPVYRVGQVLTIYYSPANLSYAQLNSSARGTSAYGRLIYAVWGFGFLGLIFLVAGVINLVAALGDARSALALTSPFSPGTR
jgi:uncharacterized protein DUF3592